MGSDKKVVGIAKCTYSDFVGLKVVEELELESLDSICELFIAVDLVLLILLTVEQVKNHACDIFIYLVDELFVEANQDLCHLVLWRG